MSAAPFRSALKAGTKPDKEPDEGVTIFNKVIANLGDRYPPG